MKDGFVKCASATIDIKVADVWYNTENIIKTIKSSDEIGIKLIVFPELCITGYTCSDLFLQKTLTDNAKIALTEIAEATKSLEITAIVGLPFVYNQTLYNCGAVVNNGSVVGIVPKSNIPNYAEFYEGRYFTAWNGTNSVVDINGQSVPFGTNILFQSLQIDNFTFAVEICEDLWVPVSPSVSHTHVGATVIANLSASNETVGKSEYRELLVKSQSSKLYCGYIYADAGYGESTTDLVFTGDNMIAENGTILARSKKYKNECVYSEIDLDKIVGERIKSNTFSVLNDDRYTVVYIDTGKITDTKLTRCIEKMPFIPSDDTKCEERCEEILTLQSLGLKKRLDHTGAKSAVIGISGGLDSTLALLVTVRAFDSLSIDRKNIIAVTMPCFGTTDRTYNNSKSFALSLGVTLREINIKDAVNQHFEDIGHSIDVYDVTFENAQARERTQILMDIANENGGLVIGTGDMSELALGWATYNGDQMSMYGVNSSVPKTLIRHLVSYESERTSNDALRVVLNDILTTPVSPELLPPKDGEISQKTEHIVGPYELHDFFLYQLMRYGFGPKKIYRLAKIAFDGEYTDEIILQWLKVFFKRFFAQQFKRSCMPDGPKIGTVALSPRGDLRMPSDASYKIWAKELEIL